MAGCPPEVFPIVLAAVEAACDPAFALLGLRLDDPPRRPGDHRSAGRSPTRSGMNSAGNALGQGNRANATIGRALQLVVRNVGGGRPQEEDRAAHGHPGKLSSCFAERLHDSPWPGLAQDRGVPDGETGVTLFAGEAPAARRSTSSPARRSSCARASARHSSGSGTGASDSVSTPPRCSAPSTAASSARHGWDRRRVPERAVRAVEEPGRRADPRPQRHRRGHRAAVRHRRSRAGPEVRKPRPDPARATPAATRGCSAWSMAAGSPAT